MTKTYIITGATSGIGHALVKSLSEDNCVFAGYRSEEKSKALLQFSNNVIPFYVDYAKPETIVDAINFIKSHCENIDTLVNIAGCVVAGPIEKISVDEIRRQFNVNVFGHLEMTQGLIDKLNNGRVINVSSMASFGFFPFISPYCASKRSLDIFFNALQVENKRNIKIISIKPGVIATPLWNKSIEENSKYLNSCQGYEDEMQCIISNAYKNASKGLDVAKVVKVILEADSTKHPALSYTVGKDAMIASIVSKLPQCIINKFVQLGLKMRIKSKGIKKRP